MKPRTLVVADRVVTADGERANVAIVIEGEKIVAVQTFADEMLREPWDNVFDARGCVVSPGFVDVHVNGGGGGLFDSGKEDEFASSARCHVRGGTTAWLPTLNSAPVGRRIEVLETLQRWASQPDLHPEVLGVYLEGPYYSPEQVGAQGLDLLSVPSPETYLPLLDRFGPLIKAWSLAVELPGAIELVRELVGRNIIAACGHSNASDEDMERAIEAGLNVITHIYCAQSSFHRRNGPEKHFGVAEIGLLRDELTVELIPDGKHLTPVMVRLILKCKPLEKVVVTTDATAAGLAPGVHKFQGRDMFVDKWVAYRPDRKLYAGSILTMIRAIQFMVEKAGVGLRDAIAMATTVPARLAGVGGRKGKIEAGYDADLVAFDENFSVRLTMCRGKAAYQALK